MPSEKCRKPYSVEDTHSCKLYHNQHKRLWQFTRSYLTVLNTSPVYYGPSQPGNDGIIENSGQIVQAATESLVNLLLEQRNHQLESQAA